MLLRIGSKIINANKIHHTIDNILAMRSGGSSQHEAAVYFGLDRTVISKLESLGEVRKGGKAAVIGFPIKNCKELDLVAQQEGADFCLLMSEQERRGFVEHKSGMVLMNEIIGIISQLRSYDKVIILGSNMRIKALENLLDKDVVGIQIGKSPIKEDQYVDPEELRGIMRQLFI
ncbi:hypothetical protein P22_2529 [Propionispora sp. 2/2-37]|uniref:hypothetical protein n=1 Tax=Propionispora sp. 2/2-37 TaxID=1677858 RepID=UPI0006BB5EEB|nr:hypothetical protein [Propionispora sp. 2/2-37]CUH96439.1 hypothetical protein P22_2529 [Propionispora sp. 2/2-37]